MNFLAATNLSTGAVTGCLTVNLPTVCSSSTKYHDALHHQAHSDPGRLAGRHRTGRGRSRRFPVISQQILAFQ